MARVTVEDCLKNIDNRYELVMLATKRVRMLYKGSEPLVTSRNRMIVTALREIAAGKVGRKSIDQSPDTLDDEDLSSIAN